MTQSHCGRPRRRGFTLIELLVVIGIIVTVAALTVLLGPALLKQDRAAQGASRLQGTLFIAKQQALRDRNPYGIRLIFDSNASGVVRSFQYIRQPDSFTGGTVQVATANSNQVSYSNVSPTGGMAAQADWLVQKGDFIQIGGPGAELKKLADPPLVPTGSPLTSTSGTFQTVNNYSSTITPTSTYRIYRSARPVPGEEVITLPDDVIIDFQAPTNWTSRSTMTANPDTGFYDILFSPSGAVLGAAGRSGQIALWVRDTSEDPVPAQASFYPADANQTLIVIFPRTGLIGAYPIDPSNPSDRTQCYSFTRDPRAGGL